MVDQLTRQSKNDLQITLDSGEAGRGIAEMSTNSLEAWRHYTTGIELFEQMIVNDALAAFESAVSYDTTFISAYISLAEMYVATQDFQNLTNVLGKLDRLRNKATTRELYKMSFWNSLLRGRMDHTIRLTREWLDNNPEDLDARFWLGTVLLGNGDYVGSAEQYESILSFDPHNRMALNMRGYTHAYQGEYDDAIRMLESYAEQSPDEPNPFDSLGEVYRFMGSMRKSITNYRRSIRNHGNMLASYVGLGNAYMDAGKFRKAHRVYTAHSKRAMDRATLRTSYRSLGYSNWKLGKADESISNMKKAMDLDDDPITSLHLILEIADDQGISETLDAIIPQTYLAIQNQLKFNPNAPKHLGDLSLAYRYQPEKTLSLLEETESTTQSGTARMWSRLYIGLLRLQTNRDDAFLESIDRFRDAYKDFILTSGSSISYYTWRVLMQINSWATEHPTLGDALYSELISYASSRGIDRAENYLRLLQGELYHRQKDPNGKHILHGLGIAEEDVWMVVGPFENKNGFSRRFRPEKNQNLDLKLRGKNGPATWQNVRDDYIDGYINLRTVLPDNNWSVCYAVTFIECPDSTDVQIRIGSNESVILWLNDEEVFKFNELRTSFLDNNIIPVRLTPGLNKVLLKISNRVGEWGFFFRITDLNGKGRSDIRFLRPDQIPTPS